MQYTLIHEPKYIKDLLTADRLEIRSSVQTDKTSVVCDCFIVYNYDLRGIFNFIPRLLLACLVMRKRMVLDLNQRR